MRFAAFLKVISIIFVSGWIATKTLAETKLKIVVDEWPPFGGAELPHQGISLHVMTTILEKAGYKIDASVVPWERALQGIKRGDYDLIGNLFADTDLKKYLTLSEPFFQTDVKFVRKKGSAISFAKLPDLKPYKIAVGEGYFYESAFDTASFLKKQVVTNTLQGLRMVAGGRVDLTLDSVDVVTYLWSRKDKSLAQKLEFVPKALATRSIHFGVRKNFNGKDKLLKDFNRLLKQMKSDGSLEKLLLVHKN